MKMSVLITMANVEINVRTHLDHICVTVINKDTAYRKTNTTVQVKKKTWNFVLEIIFFLNSGFHDIITYVI